MCFSSLSFTERAGRDGPAPLIHQEKPAGAGEEAMVENAGTKVV